MTISKRTEALAMLNTCFISDDGGVPTNQAVITEDDYRLLVEALMEPRPEELPPQWIPVSERKPSSNEGRVLLLISDESVAIENFVAAGHLDLHGQWWAGIPGNWLALSEHRWQVTHWKPRPALPSPQKTMAQDIAKQIEDGAPGDSQANR